MSNRPNKKQKESAAPGTAIGDVIASKVCPECGAGLCAHSVEQLRKMENGLISGIQSIESLQSILEQRLRQINTQADTIYDLEKRLEAYEDVAFKNKLEGFEKQIKRAENRNSLII
jgi:rubredoxin